MKKTYYEKKGRKYVPVREYDGDFVDSFTEGNHLVMVYPGGASRMYNINPAYAPLIAASRVMKDKVVNAMVNASKLRLPVDEPLTEKQLKAWRNLEKELGNTTTLLAPSISSCVDAGMKALLDEANNTLTNPAVKKAYEQFLFVYELTKNELPAND